MYIMPFFKSEKRRLTPFFKNAAKLGSRVSRGLAGIGNIARIGAEITDPGQFKGVENRTVGDIAKNILEKRKELTSAGQGVGRELSAPIQFEKM